VSKQVTINYVVVGRSDQIIAVFETEGESVAERDAELGRRVIRMPDDHPDLMAFLAKKGPRPAGQTGPTGATGPKENKS